jgi:hypothetical protein
MTFRAGHIVTCPDGHALYRATAPSWVAMVGETPKSERFERIDAAAAEPVRFAMIRTCPHCRKPWLPTLYAEARTPFDRTRTEAPT